MVTFAVGSLDKATVKVSIPPASVVAKSEVGNTEIPGMSSSVIFATTSLIVTAAPS